MSLFRNEAFTISVIQGGLQVTASFDYEKSTNKVALLVIENQLF